MTYPFIGNEAIANGKLRRCQLRSRYRAVLPDVYVQRDAALTLAQRTEAAWLWSHRQSIVAGLAAAAWHGSKWVDPELPVELIWSNARPPKGVRTYNARLEEDEHSVVADLPVTTPSRRAFDVGRRGSLTQAVVRLDALMRATGIAVDAVRAVADRHRGARGLRQLETAMELVDSGSQSPRETSLRLLLVRAGLPRPVTQIPVTTDDGRVYYLDMGWPDLMVAVEYDGEHHRLDRWQYNKDNRRREILERLGWIVIRVLVTDGPADVIVRVRNALEFRACEPALVAPRLRSGR